MKKIFFAFMATAALLAGCAKNEEIPTKEKLNIVFSVEDKAAYGADTKAVKQEWEYQDEILIMFEEYGELVDPSNSNNTILLTYYGDGEWAVSNDDTNSLQLNRGTFTAVHYPGTLALGNKADGKVPFLNYTGGEYLVGKGEWVAEGTTLNLGTIKLTRPGNMFQVSVKDLAKDKTDLQIKEAKWKLSILDDQMQQSNGVNIGHLNGTAGLHVSNKSGNTEIGPSTQELSDATGFKVGDDVAFTFLVLDKADVIGFTFVLTGSRGIGKNFDASPAKLQGGHAYLLPETTHEDWY